MAKTDTLSIRLTSRRAPYTRAGIKFASTREPLTFAQGELTTEQLLRLQADPAIQIELIDPKSGDPTSATLADILPPAEPVAGDDISGEEPGAAAPGGGSDQGAGPDASTAGADVAGQAGAGSVSPAPATSAEAAPATAPEPTPVTLARARKKGGAKS